MTLLYTRATEGQITVKTATEEDVRRYRRIFKVVEYVVPALDESFLELSELLLHVLKVLCKQCVQPEKPRLLVNDDLRVLICLAHPVHERTLADLLANTSLKKFSIRAIGQEL